MGIRTKNCEEYTTLRDYFGRIVPLFAPVDDIDALVTAVTINSTAAGTALTLRSTVCPFPCTIALTQSATGSGQSVTVTVVGFNQFNEPVTEAVTMANPTALAQTLNAFSRITSITLTTKAGTFTTETLSIGFARTNANVALRTQLGLPFKVKNAADILAVGSSSGTTEDWVTEKNVSTTYHTVGSNDSIATVLVPHTVILSAEAQLKY